MVRFFESLIDRYGGVEAAGDALLNLLRMGSAAQKVRLWATMFHVFAVADRERLEQRKAEWDELETNPERFVRELHERGRLAPVLQRLYAEGRLTLDHVDPPPAEWPRW